MSFSRRDFMALLGTSVAAAATVTAVNTNSAVAGAAVAGDAADGSTASVQGGNWIVEQIGAVTKGAVPVTLRHDISGERLVVEACRKGASLVPVAASRNFDLYLANDGRGRTQTPVHHVLAARALGAHLDRHVEQVPATLMTMDNRQSAHADLHSVNDDFVAA